jgi:hypothetical protein
MAKRTLFAILCLSFVLLVWEPVLKERAIRQQFFAPASALLVMSVAGGLRLTRRRRRFIWPILIHLTRSDTHQVLRI